MFTILVSHSFYGTYAYVYACCMNVLSPIFFLEHTIFQLDKCEYQNYFILKLANCFWVCSLGFGYNVAFCWIKKTKIYIYVHFSNYLLLVYICQTKLSILSFSSGIRIVWDSGFNSMYLFLHSLVNNIVTVFGTSYQSTWTVLIWNYDNLLVK